MRMRNYIIKRVLLAVFTVYAVTTLTFVLMRMVPGDPALLSLTEPGRGEAVSKEQLEARRKELGLDKPLHIQYFTWLSNSLRFDFGKSAWGGGDVLSEYAARLPISLNVAIMAGVMTVLIGIPLGIVSAIRQDRALDYVARIIAISGLSMPAFWVASLIIIVLLRVFDWLPPTSYVPFFEDPKRNLLQGVFPSFAVAFGFIGIITRMTRSSLLEVMREDYIRTARAKGLREQMVVLRHALRNALLPVVTILGLQLGFAIGGLVVVEAAFNLPGAGRFLLDATLRRDYNVIQASLFAIAVFVTASNLFVDILYAWLNPKVRYD